jgi:hypothetical protein
MIGMVREIAPGLITREKVAPTVMFRRAENFFNSIANSTRVDF